MKILIVEDEDIVLKPLVERFTKEGFEVIIAKDGQEALETAINAKPDFILLDIILPKIDGITMMKRLRESGSFGKNVPIMMLTNLNISDNISKKVLEFDPAYYAVKTNWTISEIVDKVKERLKMQK